MDEFAIANTYDQNAKAVIFHGSCLELLPVIPNNSIELIVTSPPYNIGKSYEKKISLERYIEQQEQVIIE